MLNNPRTIAILTIYFLSISLPKAQDYSNPDSSLYGSFATDSNSAFYESTRLPEDGDAPKPIKKPYIRFTVPFDTISELVTYMDVVNWEDEENSPQVDSLYFRAKRWIKYEFKGAKKQVIKKDDKKEFKIVMEGEFPLFIESNKFSKTQNGKIVFDMELRFKQGKYKYKINNLVHVIDPPPGEEKEIKTYFEFYRKSTINPKGNDAVLIAADKKINSILNNLKRYCKEPIFVDEDDW